MDKREVEERDREETGGAEVEGHDPTPAVLHEVVAVHITGAEAQAVGLDLSPEADALIAAYFRQYLRQELSSGNQ